MDYESTAQEYEAVAVDVDAASSAGVALDSHMAVVQVVVADPALTCVETALASVQGIHTA